jgi:protein MpaA
LRHRLTRLFLIAVCGLPALGWAEKSLKTGAERPAVPPCDELVAHLPNVSAALCRDALLVPGPARSVKGRSILLRDMPNPEAKLRVLVLGGMHGDELSSTSVALHWLALAQNQPMDLAQPVHWRFIPALNPDGLTARPAKRRVNANGVDLNRNFPTPQLGPRSAKFYWEQRTRKDPRRWPGPRPRCPSRRAAIPAQTRWRASSRDLIVSIHAPFGVLDFDGPAVCRRRAWDACTSTRSASTPARLGNYGGVHKGVPVVTVELPNAHAHAAECTEMRQMWIDLLRWMSERVSQGLGEHPR